MKSVIKKTRIQLVAEDVARARQAEVEPTTDHAACSAPPGARLVRVDGRVAAIELTCRCGSVSVLELEYEDAPAPAPPSTEVAQ